jgi:hypothetical protein
MKQLLSKESTIVVGYYLLDGCLAELSGETMVNSDASFAWYTIEVLLI